MPTLTFNNYTKYLSEVYQNHNRQMGLFLKLIEEVGEVAEELYKTPNLNKDKEASIKYKRQNNLTIFINEM
jgi:NTP pyrophosphatase (non-canonical NTP hydrolase)